MICQEACMLVLPTVCLPILQLTPKQKCVRFVALIEVIRSSEYEGIDMRGNLNKNQSIRKQPADKMSRLLKAKNTNTLSIAFVCYTVWFALVPAHSLILYEQLYGSSLFLQILEHTTKHFTSFFCPNRYLLLFFRAFLFIAFTPIS